jgi:hypothetical protein
MKRILKQLILVGFAFSMYVVAYPLDRYNPESIVEAVALKDRLVDTQWTYTWRGNEYVFGFNSDGSISKLKSWGGVKWVIVGKNEVLLEGATDRMILLFNPLTTTFTTVDWDGTKGSGKIITSQNNQVQ